MKSSINEKFPKGIYKVNDNFIVSIYLNGIRKDIDTVINLNDAIKILKDANLTKVNHKLLIDELKCKFKKIKNEHGNYIFIIKNKHIIIDKDTYPLIYKHKWYIDKYNYVKTKNDLLSRLILDCKDSNLIIQHINGNKLDNRRCNLRIITREQKSLISELSFKNSSSKYIGVYWDKSKKKWGSRIKINKELTHLGYFDRESDAALARDYASKKHYKDLGPLNFPERPGWDEYMMNLAEAVKMRSPDHYKVGGVLVSMKNNRIISTGYNSIASNLNDDIDWSQRDFINDVVIHAEMNILLYCESKFEDSVLYITTSPCVSCLKMLSASKIKKIIYKHEYKDIDKVKKLAKFLQIELIEYENVR